LGFSRDIAEECVNLYPGIENKDKAIGHAIKKKMK
jgi:hypothetical protein